MSLGDHTHCCFYLLEGIEQMKEGQREGEGSKRVKEELGLVGDFSMQLGMSSSQLILIYFPEG